MVGHDHELGERQVAKDGIVGQADVRHVKGDFFYEIVLTCPKGGGERDRSALEVGWCLRSLL